MHIMVDANGALYGGSFGCTATTPGVYQPFVPSGPAGACLSKYNLSQSSTTQVAYPQNAASHAQGPGFARGEMITISGTNLPANPQVSFDGNAVPVLYSDASRIIVPFHVGVPVTALQIDGACGFNLQVWPFFPGLFHR